MKKCETHYNEVCCDGANYTPITKPTAESQSTTTLTCDGHNWEIGQVRPEWTGGTVSVTTYQEIALIICTFCGIVRKTKIENL